VPAIAGPPQEKMGGMDTASITASDERSENSSFHFVSAMAQYCTQLYSPVLSGIVRQKRVYSSA
jgi:hypothetical protein